MFLGKCVPESWTHTHAKRKKGERQKRSLSLSFCLLRKINVPTVAHQVSPVISHFVMMWFPSDSWTVTVNVGN